MPCALRSARGFPTVHPCTGGNRAHFLCAPLRAWDLAALQCSARPDGNQEVPHPGAVASSLPLALAARSPGHRVNGPWMARLVPFRTRRPVGTARFMPRWSGGNPPVSAPALTGGQAVRAPFFSLLFLGAQEKELALQGEILPFSSASSIMKCRQRRLRTDVRSTRSTASAPPDTWPQYCAAPRPAAAVPVPSCSSPGSPGNHGRIACRRRAD